jgi:basic membrane protein A and related proteins
MRIAIVFVGEVADRGFNASALLGAEAARAQERAEITIVQGVPYHQPAIRSVLAQTVEEMDGVVFIGGQGNLAMPQMAVDHPEKRFAIVQGAHVGANLASYDVRQEDSAFLAGVLAARLTRTGVVAHLSGHRVRPGLKGRAAFVAGVGLVAPDMPVLTGFCGTQDDGRITRAWAEAQAAEGADVLFTMLNAARDGAIAAARATGMRQIGNALDWSKLEPDVFVASALARIDRAVQMAVTDMLAGRVPAEVVELGLAQGDHVALSMRDDIAADHAEAIAEVAARIAAGYIAVPDSYDGPEFTLAEQGTT